MRKWRPTALNCLYIIPDIRGQIGLLHSQLNSILPLRKSDGGRDRLVFTGNYIDYSSVAIEVVDLLIELKETYKDNIICLMGSQEYLLLSSLDLLSEKLSLEEIYTNYNKWLDSGGTETIRGYLQKAGLNENPRTFPRNRIKDLIPSDHILFYQSLRSHYESEDFLFVHSGIDVNLPIEKQDWKKNFNKDFFIKVIEANKLNISLNLPKPIIMGSHGLNFTEPFISEEVCMLDAGAPKQLLVVELHSMEAHMAYPGQKRVVTIDLLKNF